MNLREVSATFRRIEAVTNPTGTVPAAFRGVANGIQKSVDNLKEGMSSSIDTKVTSLKKEIEEAIGGTVEIISTLSSALENMQKSLDLLHSKIDVLSASVDALKNAPVVVEADSAFKKDLDTIVIMIDDLKKVTGPKESGGNKEQA